MCRLLEGRRRRGVYKSWALYFQPGPTASRIKARSVGEGRYNVG